MVTGGSGELGPDFDWSWADEKADWVPPDIDTSRPSAARMYDYALGGKDNFAVDRQAVEKVSQVFPDFRRVAATNRGFLVRAVRFMAQQGVRQFLDLGTGIPTSPNVHEIARQVHADARVVYVDNDPMVMAHNRALRATLPGIITVPHDLRRPDTILDDPNVREVIDFDRPVGLLCVAVLHFVRRDLAPEIVARFAKALAPDSYVAVSAVTSEGTPDQVIRQLEDLYTQTAAPLVLRSASQVEQLFEGLELVEPGLTEVSQWRSDESPCSVRILAGVGRRG